MMKIQISSKKIIIHIFFHILFIILFLVLEYIFNSTYSIGETTYIQTPFGFFRDYIYRFLFSVIICFFTIGNLLFNLLWLKKNPILSKSIKSESEEISTCQKCGKKKEVIYPTVLYLKQKDYSGLVLRENLLIFLSNQKKILKLSYFTLQGEICQTCFDRISFLLKKHNKKNQVYLITIIVFCIIWIFSIRGLFRNILDYVMTGWFTSILMLILFNLEINFYDKYRQVYLKVLKNQQ